MLIDLRVSEYVRQLKKAGLRPAERLTQQILRAEGAAFAPLLELALETELLHGNEPECFAPLHALRLLAEVRDTRMIDPVLNTLPIPLHYEGEQLPNSWAAEALQLIGSLGEPAIGRLLEIADDPDAIQQRRAVALLSLAYVTAVAPEARDLIVAELRDRLATSNDPIIRAHLVVALGQIGASEAYPEVMALYRQKLIDQEITPAGQARQLLLTKDEKRLACARHSLWERYDQHGPFDERQ